VPKKVPAPIAIGAGGGKKKAFKGLQPRVTAAPAEKSKAAKGKKVEVKLTEKKKEVKAAVEVVAKPSSDDGDKEETEEEVTEGDEVEEDEE
jgi:hypothetical protein